MQFCDSLGFAPTISARPTTRSAQSPSGLDFGLDVSDPGLTAPDGRAFADIEKTVVTLPEGMTVNPSQAEGLQTCTEADLARESIDSESGAGCPGGSKIGTIEVESPLLEGEVLNGTLFVAEPYKTAPALAHSPLHRDQGPAARGLHRPAPARAARPPHRAADLDRRRHAPAALLPLPPALPRRRPRAADQPAGLRRL